MRALGLVLAGGSSNRMRQLTKRRAICAMPIAGFYRSIDFALSNMTNSHIQTVAVFTQYNATSLNQHLSSSKWWDFGRKQGGLYIIPPAVTHESSNWYRGTADAMIQNLNFLKESHEPYVIITSGDCIFKMDFNKVLEYHVHKQADITIVTKDLPEDVETERYGTVSLDPTNRVIDFEEKPVVAKYHTVSCGIYIIRRRQLIELLEKCAAEGRYDFVTDILIRYKDIKRIYAYRLKNYWSNIASVEDYYKANMDFLKPELRDYFFRENPGIYTKADDLPPAKYNVGVKVHNALVSNGCIINGTVEDSVIFKKSFVGNNCYIKNAIILNDVYIGDNSHIENCIVESHCTIQANSYHRGENEIRIIEEDNERYVI